MEIILECPLLPLLLWSKRLQRERERDNNSRCNGVRNSSFRATLRQGKRGREGGGRDEVGEGWGRGDRVRGEGGKRDTRISILSSESISK